MNRIWKFMGCVSIYKIELHEVQHCLQVTVIRACNDCM